PQFTQKNAPVICRRIGLTKDDVEGSSMQWLRRYEFGVLLGFMEGGARGNFKEGCFHDEGIPYPKLSRSADWPRHSGETRLVCGRAFRTTAPNYNAPPENREHV